MVIILLPSTLADFADRSLGTGCLGNSTILFAFPMSSLDACYKTMCTVSVESIRLPKTEVFCWVIIMFSQPLSTTLGD